MQTQPFKKWKLELDGVIRAFNVVLPADVDDINVIEHMFATRKNSHRWPYDPESLELTFEYVKPIYVADNKRNKTSQTESKKAFCKTSYSYTVVKEYK